MFFAVPNLLWSEVRMSVSIATRNRLGAAAVIVLTICAYLLTPGSTEPRSTVPEPSPLLLASFCVAGYVIREQRLSRRRG